MWPHHCHVGFQPAGIASALAFPHLRRAVCRGAESTSYTARVVDRGGANPVNFQVTVLKILVSYPDGFALMADLKRDMAILATSGRDWAERTKRLAARVPDLDIFSQGLIERLNGGWRITAKGRVVLDLMEARKGVLELMIKELRPEPATRDRRR
jgi:hypothetical protein